MNHWAKMALTWAAVIAMVAAVFAVRYARVQGLFTPVTALSPGACRSIADGLQGPGDFAIDTPHNAILISATNRQAGAQDRRDGIYFLKLNDPAAPPVKLAGTPANFHPGGISLFRGPDGSESLTVIDHKSNGQYVVESYGIISDGETIKLGQQSFIRSRLLISPHGGAGSFLCHQRPWHHRLARPVCRGLPAMAARRCAVIRFCRLSHRRAAHRLSQRHSGP